MRFFALISALCIANTSLAAPLRDLHGRDEVDDRVATAAGIVGTLSSELTRIADAVKADGLLQLKPGGYDTPGALNAGFASALAGIQAIPSLSTSDNIPAELASQYGPLVNAVGDTLGYTLIDFKLLSQRIFNDPQYTEWSTSLDGGIYAVVLGLNAQFQGFGCALASSFGTGSVLGQALETVSEQTFHLLLDNINSGSC